MAKTKQDDVNAKKQIAQAQSQHQVTLLLVLVGHRNVQTIGCDPKRVKKFATA
jgi:hypothetical protein